MSKFFWILLLGLVAVLTACSPAGPASPPPTPALLPATVTRPVATPRLTPTVLRQTTTPTPSPARTHLPLPTWAVTSIFPQAWAPDGTEPECRKGPDAAFLPLRKFQVAEIIGRERSGEWWLVRIAEGQGRFLDCWVSQAVVAVGGGLETIPITEPESASLTQVNLAVVGETTRTVACGVQAAPVSFAVKGEITANGPVAKIKYAWETETGPVSQAQWGSIVAWDAPLVFEEQIQLPAQAGDYLLSLHAQFPTEMVGVTQVTLACR